MKNSQKQLNTICDLFQRRWSASILSELYALDGAKFVTLAHRLGASPTVVRATLDDLIERGWVERNPGHGHPLRPEYLLTSAGARLAPQCVAVNAELGKIGMATSELRRWSMPVLYLAGRRAYRFVEFLDTLGSVTDRALSLTLKDLCGATLLFRSVVDSYPPTSVYGATSSGQALLPILSSV